MTESTFPSPEPPPILPSYPSEGAPALPPPPPSGGILPQWATPVPGPSAGPVRASMPSPRALLHNLQTGPGGTILRSATLFYGIVFLFAIGYALFGGVAGRLFGERMPSPNDLLGGLVVGLAIVGGTHIAMRSLPVVGKAADELEAILGPLSYGAVVGLALLSGFTEELLFRGALWPHLGVAGTTFLFALVHFVPKRALLGYPIFALVAGLLIGFLRKGTENVIPCMIAHATVNGLNLAWLEGRRRKSAATAAPPVPQA